MFVPFVFILMLKQLTTTAALECGVIYDTTGSRIINGFDGGALMYPWFAVLRLNVPGDPPVCAGTLITPKHILTAAHCFTIDPDKPKEQVFTVALNEYDRCNDSAPREVHQVVKAVAHEKYNYPANPYDIAILTLNSSAKVPIACVPPATSQDVNEPGLIMGFGYTQEGGPDQPCHLRQAQVERYTRKECSETRLPESATSDPGTFCGGASGKDTCQGDSGGPFITQGSDLRYTVSGIVSYGYGCAREGFPGIYTNVAYYLDWIAGQIGDESTETDPKGSSQSGNAQRNSQPQMSDLFGRGAESRQPNGAGGMVRFPGESSNSGQGANAGEMPNPPSNPKGPGIESRVSSTKEVTFPGNNKSPMSNVATVNRVQWQQPNTVWQGHVKFNIPADTAQTNTWKVSSDALNGLVSLDTADGTQWYTEEGRRLDSGTQRPSGQPVAFPIRFVQGGLDPMIG